MIAAYLELRGVELEDREVAAGYFLELVRSKHHYRALAEETFRLSDAEMTAHVASAVRFFLRAAAPRRG